MKSNVYILRKDLTFKRVWLAPHILMLIFLIGSVVYLLSKDRGMKNLKVKTGSKVFINLDTLTFSESNLIMLIDYYKIKAPNVVLAQARHETGNYTQPIFKENNNLFGHREFPQKWEGVQMKFKNRNHLVFSHWTKSVLQYKLYQDARYNEDIAYIRHLESSGYATDPEYGNKLMSINSDIKK